MNFQLEQERIRCIGVRCPADKPRCVVENDVVRCVAISTNADGNGGGYTGRLSRAPRPLFQPQPAVVNILSPNDNMYQPNNGISPTSTNKGAMLTFISDINPDGVFGQPTTRGNVHQGQTSTPPSLPTNFDSSSPARRGIDASNSAQNFQTQNQGFPTFQENVNPNRPAANNQAQRNGASRRCFQAVNPGNCRAYIPRYFFNPSSQHCESFVYGGCGGNENNFENLSDCFRLCVLPQANNNALNEGNPAVSSDHNERRNIAQNPSIQSDVNSLFNKDLFFTSSDANSFSTLINANNANSEKVPQAPSGHSSGFAPGAPPPPPGLCSLNADPGVCLGNSPRYFYNANSQRCERFTFGGCGGNRNNFRTFEECKSTCDYFDDYINGQSNGQLGNSRTNTRPTDNFGQNSPNYPRNPPASPVSQQPRGFAPGAPPAAPRSCFMPADAGPCLRRVQRFYFNPQSQRCESFSFGGCGGNQNNFATMDDCKTTCDYFDEYVNQQSSGGVGTGTVIDDSAAYRAKGGVPTPPGLRCRLRPDPGPCTGSRPRYFYNTNSKRCEGFTYGGCDGNENNFLTLIDCRNACDQFVEQRNVDLSQQIPSMMPQPTTDGVFRLPALPSNQLSSGQNFQASRPNVNNANRPTRPDSSTPGDQNSRPSFCYQRAQTGLCRAYIKRYFYNTNTGRCEQFVYGGCRPNQNNFQTENECKQACVGNAGGNVKPEADRQTVNSLFENPSSPAPFGSFRLARDNAGSRTLSLRPNFSNEDSNNRPVVNRPNHQQPAPDRVTSVSNRQTQTNVCTFPVDFGSCFQHIPSYYYDSNSGTCQAFIFRGCGGNQNRFSSFLQCESQCSGRNSGGSNDADALSFPSFPSIF